MHRILFVDDEKNVLNALRRELKDEYEVETFSNPVAALQRSHEIQFDLVVADYQMPEMNGIQFLKQFGKVQPDATRLILSGHADTSVLTQAINETHIYRIIDKPWSKTELEKTLIQALDYRQAIMEARRLTETSLAKSKLQHILHEPEKRYQILVVDDEPNILSAATRDLTSRSTYQDLHMLRSQEVGQLSPMTQMDFRFEVYTTTSPLQALDYAKQVACDVVIVDYQMPQMNGFEFLELFKAIQPETARIILSGHTDKKTLTEAINNIEVFSFISKPWREYELKSAVSQAIISKDHPLKDRLQARENSYWPN